MKKIKCKRCGKYGIFYQYKSGNSFIEHSKKKSDLKICGQYVMDVQGCYFPEWETKGWISKEAYEKYLANKKAPSPENAIY